MPADAPGWLRSRSIRLRVTFAASALLAVALVVGGVALLGLERRSLVSEIDSGLRDRIQGLVTPDERRQVSTDVPLTGRETGVVQIIDSRGEVVAATPGLHDAPILASFKVTDTITEMTVNLKMLGEPSARWRVAGVAARSGIGPVAVYAGTSLAGLDRTVHRFQLLMILGIPLLVAGFVIIVWSATGWAVGPVDNLIREVDEIQTSRLDQELAIPPTGDEIARLAVTLNQLLRRLGDTRQRERRFAADASHELRSPLAAARLTLEVAVAHPDRVDWRQAATDTLAEIDRLEDLARDLLELTRLDPTRVAEQSRAIDLGALVGTEVDHRSHGATGRTYEFVAPAAPVVVAGVETLLLRALRNVFDNAERHAQRRICAAVSIDRSSMTATVTISNDGPPIAESDRTRTFEPFTRLDDARTDDDGGTGLGLAIVADIARAHRGVAAFIDPPDGMGATLRMSLPLGPDLPLALPGELATDEFDGTDGLPT